MLNFSMNVFSFRFSFLFLVAAPKIYSAFTIFTAILNGRFFSLSIWASFEIGLPQCN